jgi:hypothetical protein
MIAYFRDVCVGAVRCQYEPPSNDPANTLDGRIYIMTLGVLAPYRRYGIGILLVPLSRYLLVSLKSIYSHILKEFVFLSLNDIPFILADTYSRNQIARPRPRPS